MDKLKNKRNEHRTARQNTSLLKAPLLSLKIFLTGIYEELLELLLYLTRHKNILGVMGVVTLVFLTLVYIPGPHTPAITELLDQGYLVIWWVTLGILSSVGLGTGLHTFLLYLGPFIAQVTLAASECKTLNFKQYGPDRFLCPSEEIANNPKIPVPSLLEIVPLVWTEAFLWGAGTAIGELPPYFVAYKASECGKSLEEIEKNDEEDEKEENPSSMGARLSKFVDGFLANHFSNRGPVAKFLIIMAFASIPNPLFDLAGLACGYQLVPFLGFFLPTLVGKGVIKVTIQSIFVILVFSKSTLNYLFAFVDAWVPFMKGSLQKRFDDVRAQFHRMPGEEHQAVGKSYLSMVWDVFLAVMILYFIVSIVDSKVQEYLIKEQQKEITVLEKELFQATGGNPNTKKKLKDSDSNTNANNTSNNNNNTNSNIKNSKKNSKKKV